MKHRREQLSSKGKPSTKSFSDLIFNSLIVEALLGGGGGGGGYSC